MQPKPKPSPWDEVLAADREQRNSIASKDLPVSWNSLARGMARIAGDGDHWAGMPLPIDGIKLVVEPSYPFAEAFEKINGEPPPAPETAFDRARVRNRFYSMSRRSDIVVFELDGHITWGLDYLGKHLEEELETLRASDVWSLETEFKALETLRSYVNLRQFRQYLLTGSFVESSKRSRVYYLFRRLRPTVAMTASGGKRMRVLCALCLHPIAYYANSWAGAMCPTDDVLAHLALMRGDEHMFWKRANQHPAWRPEAGL